MAWGPTLTPEQEALLSSQVDETIPSQLTDLNQSRAALVDDIIPELEELKDLHKTFYDWFNDDVGVHYDAEKAAYYGDSISNPVVESDFTDAIDREDNSRFFPDGRKEFTPKYLDELKGITDSHTDDNESCLHPIADALADSLNNGLNGTGNTTTTGAISYAASIDIPVVSITGFVVGADLYVLDTGGLKRMIGRITQTLTTPFRLRVTVTAWCADGSIASGSAVSDTSTNKDTLLRETRDRLVGHIQAQKDALDLNEDNISYVGVAADITTASAAAAQTISDYNSSWTYSALLGYLDARLAFMTGTRLAQIILAVDTADDGIYDRRYDWINYLLNRKMGSWELLARHENSVSYLDEDIDLYTEQGGDLEEWRSG